MKAKTVYLNLSSVLLLLIKQMIARVNVWFDNGFFGVCVYVCKSCMHNLCFLKSSMFVLNMY